MSDATMRDAMVRMATDAEFARRVREDGPAVAREHGLSASELSALQALDSSDTTAGPGRLGERLSKSGLFGAGVVLSAVGNLGSAASVAPDGLLCDGHSFVCDGHSLLCDGHSFVCDGHSLVCNGHSFVCNGHSLLCNGHTHAPASHHAVAGVQCDGHAKVAVVKCNAHLTAGIQCNGHPTAGIQCNGHPTAEVVRCNGHAITGIQCNGHPTAGIQCNGHPTAGIQCNGHAVQLHPPVVGLPGTHSLLIPPSTPEGTAK
ncbi:MAG: hypothetical protein HOV77_15085 [Hamadaea sp.]|uniref:hypothetical protein n=1 Tax=Hamadaea sp. TaxID=2024425 RepID=UPI001839DE57|nr:hypothetical protein [Hamadaea sp.]NUT20508.1 hypothetical protein [Hamadaea sp.]